MVQFFGPPCSICKAKLKQNSQRRHESACTKSQVLRLDLNCSRLTLYCSWDEVATCSKSGVPRRGICADHNARCEYVVQSCHRCQQSEAENERERRRSLAWVVRAARYGCALSWVGTFVPGASRPGGTGRAGRARARPKIGSTTTVTTCFSFFFIGSVVEYLAAFELAEKTQMKNKGLYATSIREDFDRRLLDLHLSTLKATFPQHLKSTSLSIHDVKAFIQNMNVAERSLISEVVTLLQLILVLPSTNAVSERTFSAMRRLKTYLRATMK